VVGAVTAGLSGIIDVGFSKLLDSSAFVKVANFFNIAVRPALSGITSADAGYIVAAVILKLDTKIDPKYLAIGLGSLAAAALLGPLGLVGLLNGGSGGEQPNSPGPQLNTSPNSL
jgi:hypothetical protein